MQRRKFIKFGAVAAGAVCSIGREGLAQGAAEKPAESPAAPGNPFVEEGNWYKTQLHVHTTTSDGDVPVATRIKQYRDLGYDVVAVTDHWKTNDLSSFSDDKFVAINSMEAHPKTSTGAPAHHFVCLDLPHPFELDRNQDAQSLIDKVHEVGGKVIYAHPYWTAHTLEEMKSVKGFIGIEVYNAICDLNWRKGYSDTHIDQALNKLGLFFISSVDDVHKTSQIDKGWVMVKAKGLTKSAIMDAIGKGHLYATTGAEITDFRVEQGVAKLACKPASEIRFFYNGQAGGHYVTAKGDKLLEEASCKLRKGVKWVRAEIVSAEGKRAWTNPLALV